MNMADGIVILIIAIGIWIGATKGAIKMLLSLGSSLAAVVVSFFVQPIVLVFLETYTKLYDVIKDKIIQNFEFSNMPMSDMKLVSEKMGIEQKLLSLQEFGADRMTHLAMQIISFLISFLLIVVIFFLVAWILSGIGKLPLIREVNKLAGAITGGVLSILIIWIGMMVLNYWFSTGQKLEILEMIQTSMVAKYIYSYNILAYILTMMH